LFRFDDEELEVVNERKAAAPVFCQLNWNSWSANQIAINVAADSPGRRAGRQRVGKQGSGKAARGEAARGEAGGKAARGEAAGGAREGGALAPRARRAQARSSGFGRKA
jgi:hypothetical protein